MAPPVKLDRAIIAFINKSRFYPLPKISDAPIVVFTSKKVASSLSAIEITQYLLKIKHLPTYIPTYLSFSPLFTHHKTIKHSKIKNSQRIHVKIKTQICTDIKIMVSKHTVINGIKNWPSPRYLTVKYIHTWQRKARYATSRSYLWDLNFHGNSDFIATY